MAKTKTSNVAVAKLSRAELEREVLKLSKRANTRLAQLEESGYTSEYVYQTLYKKAIQGKYIFLEERRGNEFEEYGKPRFSSKVKGRSQAQLRNELAELKRFINSKTTTVRGIKKSYNSAYLSFKSRYPEFDISFDEWRAIFENESTKMAFEMYSSSAIIEAMSDAYNNGVSMEDIVNNLNIAVNNSMTLSDANKQISGVSMIEKYRRENPDTNFVSEW